MPLTPEQIKKFHGIFKEKSITIFITKTAITLDAEQTDAMQLAVLTSYIPNNVLPLTLSTAADEMRFEHALANAIDTYSAMLKDEADQKSVAELVFFQANKNFISPTKKKKKLAKVLEDDKSAGGSPEEKSAKLDFEATLGTAPAAGELGAAGASTSNSEPFPPAQGLAETASDDGKKAEQHSTEVHFTAAGGLASNPDSLATDVQKAGPQSNGSPNGKVVASETTDVATSATATPITAAGAAGAVPAAIPLIKLPVDQPKLIIVSPENLSNPQFMLNRVVTDVFAAQEFEYNHSWSAAECATKVKEAKLKTVKETIVTSFKGYLTGCQSHLKLDALLKLKAELDRHAPITDYKGQEQEKTNGYIFLRRGRVYGVTATVGNLGDKYGSTPEWVQILAALEQLIQQKQQQLLVSTAPVTDAKKSPQQTHLAKAPDSPPKPATAASTSVAPAIMTQKSTDHSGLLTQSAAAAAAAGAVSVNGGEKETPAAAEAKQKELDSALQLAKDEKNPLFKVFKEIVAAELTGFSWDDGKGIYTNEMNADECFKRFKKPNDYDKFYQGQKNVVRRFEERLTALLANNDLNLNELITFREILLRHQTNKSQNYIFLKRKSKWSFSGWYLIDEYDKTATEWVDLFKVIEKITNVCKLNVIKQKCLLRYKEVTGLELKKELTADTWLHVITADEFKQHAKDPKFHESYVLIGHNSLTGVELYYIAANAEQKKLTTDKIVTLQSVLKTKMGFPAKSKAIVTNEMQKSITHHTKHEPTTDITRITNIFQAKLTQAKKDLIPAESDLKQSDAKSAILTPNTLDDKVSQIDTQKTRFLKIEAQIKAIQKLRQQFDAQLNELRLKVGEKHEDFKSSHAEIDLPIFPHDQLTELKTAQQNLSSSREQFQKYVPTSDSLRTDTGLFTKLNSVVSLKDLHTDFFAFQTESNRLRDQLPKPEVNAVLELKTEKLKDNAQFELLVSRSCLPLTEDEVKLMDTKHAHPDANNAIQWLKNFIHLFTPIEVYAFLVKHIERLKQQVSQFSTDLAMQEKEIQSRLDHCAQLASEALQKIQSVLDVQRSELQALQEKVRQFSASGIAKVDAKQQLLKQQVSQLREANGDVDRKIADSEKDWTTEKAKIKAKHNIPANKVKQKCQREITEFKANKTSEEQAFDLKQADARVTLLQEHDSKITALETQIADKDKKLSDAIDQCDAKFDQVKTLAQRAYDQKIEEKKAEIEKEYKAADDEWRLKKDDEHKQTIAEAEQFIRRSYDQRLQGAENDIKNYGDEKYFYVHHYVEKARVILEQVRAINDSKVMLGYNFLDAKDLSALQNKMNANAKQNAPAKLTLNNDPFIECLATFLNKHSPLHQLTAITVIARKLLELPEVPLKIVAEKLFPKTAAITDSVYAENIAHLVRNLKLKILERKLHYTVHTSFESFQKRPDIIFLVAASLHAEVDAFCKLIGNDTIPSFAAQLRDQCVGVGRQDANPVLKEKIDDKNQLNAALARQIEANMERINAENAAAVTKYTDDRAAAQAGALKTALASLTKAYEAEIKVAASARDVEKAPLLREQQQHKVQASNDLAQLKRLKSEALQRFDQETNTARQALTEKFDGAIAAKNAEQTQGIASINGEYTAELTVAKGRYKAAQQTFQATKQKNSAEIAQLEDEVATLSKLPNELAALPDALTKAIAEELTLLEPAAAVIATVAAVDAAAPRAPSPLVALALVANAGVEGLAAAVAASEAPAPDGSAEPPATVAAAL